MLFDRTVSNITRISEVINILLKYSFEDIVSSTALKRFIPTKQQLSWTRADKSVFEYSRWERIRMVIEELGPTFVKLAQMLSNRPDIIPPQLIAQFSKLQSDVQVFSHKTAMKILEKQLDDKIDAYFEFFDSMPIGAASIGQVYRARLKDGRDVVVKIQRPGVVKKVKTDLSLLREFISITENYFVQNGILNPLDIVDTFEEIMLQELDYNAEANNICHFRKIYKYNRKFIVPNVLRELSGKQVLVMEFVSGCKVDDEETIKSWGLKTNKIANNLIQIYLSQIFENGYFHGDPHPGNVLVQPNGKLALIDFGMMGKLTKKQKYAFAGVMLGLAQEDYRSLASNIRRLAANSEIKNMVDFENDLEELIDDFNVIHAGEMDMSDLTVRLQKIIYDYRLQIPGIIFIILRVFSILEGICRKLNPDFEIVEAMRPMGIKIISEQYSVKNVRAELRYNLSHLGGLLYDSPIDLRYILKKLRTGDLETNINIKGYEPFLNKMESITNRLIITILIFTLTISGSIIYTSSAINSMNYLLGIPILPLFAYIIAAFLSILLLLSIIRNRKKTD